MPCFPYLKNIVKSVGTDDLNPIYNWVDNFMIYNLTSTGDIPSLLAGTRLIVQQICLNTLINSEEF